MTQSFPPIRGKLKPFILSYLKSNLHKENNSLKTKDIQNLSTSYQQVFHTL